MGPSPPAAATKLALLLPGPVQQAASTQELVISLFPEQPLFFFNQLQSW